MKNLDTEINPSDYFTNNRHSNYRNCNYNKRNTTTSCQWQLGTPKMLGYFSVNEYREFVPDASQLRYLRMPQANNVHLNLNDGIKDFIWKPESVKSEKMDFLLRYIVNNIEKLKAKNGIRCQNKLLNSDIICSRGRLVQIMCPQYITDKAWSLIVSKYKGNIYICQPDGEDLHTLQTAYGFKFEQFLLSGTFIRIHIRTIKQNFLLNRKSVR